MIVLYRVAPNKPIKSPILKDDKFTFFKMCLKSFAKAFDGTDYQIVFILDSCPIEYTNEILSIVPKDRIKLIEQLKDAGNLGTFRRQVELACALNDYVLFQEDDYLYLEGTGKHLVGAVGSVDFVTPQDEYEYYHNPLHAGKYEIKVIGDRHFREVNSTTLTFAAHSKNIRALKDVMYEHEIWDFPMWQDIREKGYKIYAPVPTLAAHMVEGILPPTIDWSTVWSKYLS